MLARLAEASITLDPKDPRVARLLEDIKRLAAKGYAYDGAEASFELLARRALGQVPDYFAVESFRVTVERRKNARGTFATVSEGVSETECRGAGTGECRHRQWSGERAGCRAAQGLGKYSPFLADLRLVDYKVRILTSGTEAVTRVMVESADGKGERWSTVGCRRISSTRRSRRWPTPSSTSSIATARAFSAQASISARFRVAKAASGPSARSYSESAVSRAKPILMVLRTSASRGSK